MQAIFVVEKEGAQVLWSSRLQSGGVDKVVILWEGHGMLISVKRRRNSCRCRADRASDRLQIMGCKLELELSMYNDSSIYHDQYHPTISNFIPQLVLDAFQVELTSPPLSRRSVHHGSKACQDHLWPVLMKEWQHVHAHWACTCEPSIPHA
ncbi:hypothetical protein BJ165DRAFT_1447703 [Panaeolus papilionaceus]|nr:hypothetical protein BJ165DRAFT_1447703 [Panaeolus papilionaceus]